MLTRESILKADDLQRTEVAVPEWGGSVYVRALTGAERVRIMDNLDVMELVLMTCVDAKGRQMFGPDDAEALAGKNGAALERIAKAAIDVNFLGSDAIDAAGKD